MIPEITLVIPVHNGARFLADALGSVALQGVDAEVIVVDDGSTDHSGEIARNAGVTTVIRQEQQGPGLARNAGIAAAHAPLVGFLDADDLIPAGALALQIDHLAAHPGSAGVIGMQDYAVVDGAALPDWAVADGVGGAAAVRRPYAMGVVARRPAFDVIGGFDPRFQWSEDVDWLFRAKDLGHQIDVIDDVVRIRRIHGANHTYDTKSLRRSQFEVLAARARRKRELP
jgi:glycosyltransferase involved in cell wall biosynthesis